MKIYLSQIPVEGISLEEDILPEQLNLDNEVIKFRAPVLAKAQISRITNAITVEMDIRAVLRCVCGRCVEEFDSVLERSFSFSCAVDPRDRFIDLDPEIRQELILDLPLSPLCRPDCRGLCIKCGCNLNSGKCSCSGQ